MKILIVEDEPQTARMLHSIILELRPASQVEDVLDSIESAVDFLSDEKNIPDVIFLDIQLADGLSFEIFKQVEVKSPVIFCTAYDEYTLQAFKSNGIDYLLKPVKGEDVKMAFEKLEGFRLMMKWDFSLLDLFKQSIQPQKDYRKSLLLQSRENFIPLQVAEVAVFFVSGEVLYAYTFSNQKHAIFRPLSELEQEINPDDFFRISRQALVNRKAVVEIQPYFNRKVVVKTTVKLSESLVVSRLKVSEFMKWMEG
jgi:two-component system, LytTR family, response regulator LytT